MENENINTQNGEKTFTQEDVNRIVSDRLAKEKGKADAALAEREAGLTAREKVLETREKLAGAGLPGELMNALNLYGEGEIDKAVAILAKHYKQAQDEDTIPAGFKPGANPASVNGAKPGYGIDRSEYVNRYGAERAKESLRQAMGLK